MGLLDNWYQGRTLVFGHRGASAYAPMNTLPAFELAADQGADGIELDVWLSADRHLVVIHDATVDHTTGGSGCVYHKTLADLKALDASHRLEPYKGARIPTLDEVFQAVGQRLYINVEVKADRNMLPGTEQAVADSIRSFGLESRVIVSSFSSEILKTFRAIAPEVPIGFLYSEETRSNDWELIQTVPHEARHPRQTMIDASVMVDIKRDGYRVNTWTVNDPARAAELRSLGVDAIITDKPDVILQALRG